MDKMQPPAYFKYCAVPQCKSTNKKNPNKLFIYVPSNRELRKKWLNLAGRDGDVSIKSRMYFCEEHFDLPNDMENYIQYCIMGSVRQIRMRPECVPSKFACQADGVKPLKPRRKASKIQQKGSIQKLSAHQVVSVGTEAAMTDDSTVYMYEEDRDDKSAVLQATVSLWPEVVRSRLHDEISLPCSPSNIKQEPEFEEDSKTEDKVEDYESIILKMKEEMAELRTKNQYLSDENRILKERISNVIISSDINQLLQKSEDKIITYEQEKDIKNLEKENVHLTNTIECRNQKINRLSKKIEELTQQTQGLTERVKEFQERIPIEKRQFLKVKRKCLVLKNTILRLRKKIYDLEQNREDPIENNKSLTEKVQIVNITGENETLAERVRKLTDEPSVDNVGTRNKKKRCIT